MRCEIRGVWAERYTQPSLSAQKQWIRRVKFSVRDISVGREECSLYLETYGGKELIRYII